MDRQERSEIYKRYKFVMPDTTKLFPFYVAKETGKCLKSQNTGSL
jgi:hypothetical protein